MVNSPSEILALTNEAAVFVRNGKVQYANACACGVLGSGCTGRTVRELFGADIAEAQAGSFVSGGILGEKQYVLRVSSVDDGQVYFFSPQDSGEEYMNDAFLFSLRSSLTGLSFAAERARELSEGGDPEMTVCINSITHSYYKISRLIRNITAVRSAAGIDRFCEFRVFDLSELCRSLADTVTVLKPDENIVFGFQGCMPVCGSQAAAELLLENLISNCIIHAKGRSRIMINLMDAGDSVILSVSDDGCGIPPELLPKVFERYRYGFELCEMGGGSGFGLSAALAGAEYHGGTLLLESRPGYGTSVRASLKKGSSITLSCTAEQQYITMNDVLTGLADCLPDECFSAKHLD